MITKNECYSNPAGSAIAKSGQIGNSVLTLHTVTAGKTLALLNINFTFDIANASSPRIFVTNGADVEQYNIVYASHSGALSSVGCFAMNFATPLRIPAGYKIKIEGSDTSGYVRAFIYGFED